MAFWHISHILACFAIGKRVALSKTYFMEQNIDSLKRLLDSIKTIGFWGRLFGWSSIKQLLVDASADLQKLISRVENLNDINSDLLSKNANVEKDLKMSSEALIRKDSEVARLTSSLQEANSKISQLEKEVASKDSSIIGLNNRLNEVTTESKVTAEANNHLTSENKRLAAEVASNSEAISNSAAKVSELSIANSSLVEKNAILTDENKRLSTEAATNAEAILNSKAKINELTLSNNTLQEKNNALTTENKKLTAEVATHVEAIENLSKRSTELTTDNKVLAEANGNLLNDNKRLSKENTSNGEIIAGLSQRKNELDVELSGLKSKLEAVQTELKTVKQQNIELTRDEENRRQKYEADVTTLTSIRDQIQAERAKEIEERNNAEIDRVRSLKETWNKHQDTVKSRIKSICAKHAIEYMDKVPFRGEPDNTLRICEELVIFDAKSPGSDDLNNFPTYIKDQAEKAKKYAKQDTVKRDIFFVVPSNTLERLPIFVYNLADYDVFVISIDVLEPIILSLKKIEEYEFAEQLSPEERENICRVLGKFAHLTKRRIQIDSFFAKQFIELAYKCETDLPSEIFEKVVEFEKSEKLNPPVEKRAKAISTKELEKDTTKLKTEATAKGILIDDLTISVGLNELPLYNTETENS